MIYQIEGILDKNRNYTSVAVADMMMNCDCDLARTVFKLASGESDAETRARKKPRASKTGHQGKSTKGFLRKAAEMMSRRGRGKSVKHGPNHGTMA